MIRKQVYLERRHDRKLKALAELRGCTEAEVIREALDRLPDPAGTLDDRLAAAGLVVPPVDAVSVPSGAALRDLEAEVEAWLGARSDGLGLSDAVLEERDGR